MVNVPVNTEQRRLIANYNGLVLRGTDTLTDGELVVQSVVSTLVKRVQGYGL